MTARDDHDDHDDENHDEGDDGTSGFGEGRSVTSGVDTHIHYGPGTQNHMNSDGIWAQGPQTI